MEDEFKKEPARPSPKPPFDFSWIENISLSTIIYLLVEKGIFTPNEIIDKERKLRLAAKSEYKAYATHSHHSNHSNHHHSSPIKNFACKYRWSRRLTSKIFGWKWKKSKSIFEKIEDLY